MPQLAWTSPFLPGDRHQDLWVLRDADMEATQVLTSWRQEQWTASKAHDLHRWDAKTLQSFLKSLELPGEGLKWVEGVGGRG